ncbi:hypothetical protein BV898_13024 [Hypsibius exemplaris]|uniref:G-protein coupled receptors family 1 profile domain-containing protein n=1 Tax=Hypsibius exemplaris TaxID=2072580 RepID=A0A1W0WC14_HYPEX|nr:hypothetical protein BV898_13024 [Hypsibius exemplaris]
MDPYPNHSTNHYARNTTNSTSVDLFALTLGTEKTRELLAAVVVTVTLSFLGALGNLLVMLITWPRSSVKSGLDLLIFHFVGANFFMLLVNIPVGVLMIAAKQWGYKAPIHTCAVVQTIFGTGWSAINWMDAALAINRFIALFFPHTYRIWTSKAITWGTVIFTWLISLATNIPLAFNIGGRMVLLPLGYCAALTSKDNVDTALTTLKFYLPYALTGVAAVILLFKTYFGMKSRNRITQRDGRSFVAVVRRFRMARMVLLVFLWTGVCVLPGNIVSVSFAYVFTQNPVSGLWLRTCLVLQYGFTPCILLLTNAEYRVRCRRLLGKLSDCTCRAVTDAPPTSNKHHSRDRTLPT